MAQIIKTRGIWLNIWLSWMLVTNIMTALTYFLLNQKIAIAYPDIPLWVWYLYGAGAFINCIFIIFLFKWKKWPFFSICGMTGLVFLGNLILGVGTITSLSGFLGPIILYLSMRSRWKLFS